MTDTPSTPPIRVALVEDADGVRQALVDLLQTSPGFQCAGAHATAEAALRAIPAAPPDVVLMDINLKRMNGIECVRRLKTHLPEQLILMLTAYGDDDLIFQALKAGANGYLLKQAPSDDILTAIQEVHAGGAPMSSNIARKVIQSFHQPSPSGSPRDTLSPREFEILQLLAKGYIKKEIAEQLGLAFQTVHSHIRRIYEKLHVRSRTQAVAKYLEES